MRYPSKALTQAARTRPDADHYADGLLHAEFAERAKVNPRASALRGLLLAVCISMVALPIIFLTNGCSADWMAAELSLPGILLMGPAQLAEHTQGAQNKQHT